MRGERLGRRPARNRVVPNGRNTTVQQLVVGNGFSAIDHAGFSRLPTQYGVRSTNVPRSNRKYSTRPSSQTWMDSITEPLRRSNTMPPFGSGTTESGGGSPSSLNFSAMSRAVWIVGLDGGTRSISRSCSGSRSQLRSVSSITRCQPVALATPYRLTGRSLSLVVPTARSNGGEMNSGSTLTNRTTGNNAFRRTSDGTAKSHSATGICKSPVLVCISAHQIRKCLDNRCTP